MKSKKLFELEHEEHIIFQVRRHWFILAVEVSVICASALLPLVVVLTLNLGQYAEAFHLYLITCYALWLLILWMTLFNIWTNYWLDVWTLTNKRFVAVDQHGLFKRTTASFQLARLQDITVKVHGIIPTMLNFGSLEIQTAGEMRVFKTKELPDPENLKSAIFDASYKESAPLSQDITSGM